MASKAITVGEQHSGCPHLGTTVDSRTRFVYPSQRAACYANSKPVSILLGHQETYCFADKYVECPIFTQPKNEPASKRRLFLLPILLLTIFALVLLAILIAFATRGTGAKQEAGLVDAPSAVQAGIIVTIIASTQPSKTASPDPLFAGSFEKTAEPTSSPTQRATKRTTPTGTSKPSVTSSPTLTPTVTNSPTATSTATQTATPTSTSSPKAIFVPALPTTLAVSPTSGPNLPARPSPNANQPTATRLSLNP